MYEQITIEINKKVKRCSDCFLYTQTITNGSDIHHLCHALGEQITFFGTVSDSTKGVYTGCPFRVNKKDCKHVDNHNDQSLSDLRCTKGYLNCSRCNYYENNKGKPKSSSVREYLANKVESIDNILHVNDWSTVEVKNDFVKPFSPVMLTFNVPFSGINQNKYISLKYKFTYGGKVYFVTLTLDLVILDNANTLEALNYPNPLDRLIQLLPEIDTDTLQGGFSIT